MVERSSDLGDVIGLAGLGGCHLVDGDVLASLVWVAGLNTDEQQCGEDDEGDPSPYQALCAIRRIRRSAGLQGAGPVATALMAGPAADLARLWGPEVTVIWPECATAEDPSIGGSHIAELLDLLVDERAFGDTPVLAFAEPEFTEAEQQLRVHLEGLRAHYGEAGDLPVEVAALLRRYGAAG